MAKKRGFGGVASTKGVRHKSLNKKAKNTGTTNPIVKGHGMPAAQKATPKRSGPMRG